MSQGTSKNPTVESKGCAERREEILDAATRLFAAHGFANADTQRLVDELGVGKGTLYRYFPSKRALFLAAADRVMLRLRDRIDASTAGVDDPLEQITEAVGAYLDFFGEHSEYVELLTQERAQFKDRETPTYFVHREKSVQRWRDLYRSLIAEGRVRDIPVRRITDVVLAAMYGSMTLKYFSGRPETFATSAEDILDIIFFGILTRAERQRQGMDQEETPGPGARRNDLDQPASATP